MIALPEASWRFRRAGMSAVIIPLSGALVKGQRRKAGAADDLGLTDRCGYGIENKVFRIRKKDKKQI